MKNKVLSIVVAGLFCMMPISPAIGGVEPSPFLGDILGQISLIRLSRSMTDANNDSLTAIEGRLENIAQTSQVNPWMTQELVDQAFSTINRMSLLMLSLDETDFSQVISIMDKMSFILFDPQPEPPGYIAEGFTVLERLSRVEFDPQPEPPGLPQSLIPVMARVASTLVSTSTEGPRSGKIPALTALERLSGQLVDSVINRQPGRAAAKVTAMYNITIGEQYSGQ